MIHELEELGMNAWPSLTTVAYDGWLLRFADGYTRRANSVHPLYAGSAALDAKIDACERLYGAHQVRTAFKLTEVSQPGDLEAALEARGYTYDSGALIMTAPVTAPKHISNLATIVPAATPEWVAHYCRLNVHNPRHHPTITRLFASVVLPYAFISLSLDERVVAVGVAIAERGYVGLFGLAVDAAYRRRGLGAQLVETCMAWGAEQGARRAYLQVVEDNTAAMSLYTRAGFSPAYHYWYREQPV